PSHHQPALCRRGRGWEVHDQRRAGRQVQIGGVASGAEQGQADRAGNRSQGRGFRIGQVRVQAVIAKSRVGVWRRRNGRSAASFFASAWEVQSLAFTTKGDLESAGDGFGKDDTCLGRSHLSTSSSLATTGN